MGTHYNPFGVDHGSPDDDVRHVGALGNVESDENGNVTDFVQLNELVQLYGPTSVIGRGCVLHAG